MGHRRNLEAFVWSLIGGTGAFAVALGIARGFSLDLASTRPVLLAVAALLGVGMVYRHWRPDARIAVTTISIAQLIAFCAVAGALSYIVSATQRPSVSATLMEWDLRLGLDWRAWLAFLEARPGLNTVLGLAYRSIGPQIFVIALALGLTGRVEDCRAFIAAFAIASLVVIAISGLVPADDVHVYLGLHDEGGWASAAAFIHVADLAGLRDGSLRHLVIDRLQGIITVPSLHAALAVVFAYAFWQVPRLRWPGLALNGTMLVATPTHGSHFFVDVLAGIATAIASLALVRLIAQADVSSPRRRPAAALEKAA